MVNTRKKLNWIMCVFFTLSGLLLQNLFAVTNCSISFHGRWEEGARSISSTIPVSAYINNGFLSIHSSTQQSDIIICIFKDGKVVYEEKIPALETNCITIDVGNLSDEIYSIELTNQWGDYLIGYLK